MESIRRFLESLELVPEFRRWVKSLELWGINEEGNAVEVVDALSSIVEYCIELEEMELNYAKNVNFALFAQLKHLRSLKCIRLHRAYFEPIVGKSRTFESLVSLSFVGGSPIRLSDPSLFAPAVLPSLRRLSIYQERDEGPMISNTDLYDIASQLRHLSFDCSGDSLDPLLDKCTDLLSLAISGYDTVSSTRRLCKPLVGLRQWSGLEDEESEEVMELLDEALSSGLISASADSRTVVFLYDYEREFARAAGFTEWAESVGLELQYYDGALQQEWRSDGLDQWDSFTEWVDGEAARREAAAEERRRIKR